MTEAVKLGRIKFYSEKGYGFIEPDNGSDIFFHITDCPMNDDEPELGQRCSFEVGERNGKPLAKSVRWV